MSGRALTSCLTGVCLLFVAIFVSCRGGDDEISNSCSTIWEVHYLGDETNSSFIYGESSLEVSSRGASAYMILSEIAGDFDIRLTFVGLELENEGAAFATSLTDTRGNMSYSGIANFFLGYASSSSNRAFLSAGFGEEADWTLGVVEASTDSGTFLLSRKGNTLTISLQMGFESWSASKVYDFAPESVLSFEISVFANQSANDFVKVELLDFVFKGAGDYSDDFNCDRLFSY